MNNSLTKIYVVRHAQSLFNASDNAKEFKFDDEFGSSLSDKGKMQANSLKEGFKDINFSAIFTSDLTRTKQTAEVIALEKKLDINASKLIRERSIHEYLHKRGNLSNESISKLQDEMRAIFEKLSDEQKMEYKHTPDMESPKEAAERLLRFIKEAAIAYPNKTILIVCHGNIMRSLLVHLGYAKFDELPNGTIGNTGFFVLESDGIDFFIKEVSDINKQEGQIRTF